MNYINLVALLKAMHQIKNVEVYGRIISRLKRPANIMESVQVDETKGMFVKVDVFAVRLSGIQKYLKDCGYYAKNDIYMVNGQLVTYIEANKYVLPDWYYMRGTLASSQVQPDYISLFKWGKTGAGWSISFTELGDFVFQEFEHDNDMNSYIHKSFQENIVVRPDYVNNLQKFYAVDPRTLNNQPVVENKSLNAQIQQSLNNVQIATTVSNSSFVQESRQDIKEYSTLATKLKDDLKKAKSSRTSFIQNLISKYEIEDEITDYIMYTIDGVRSFLKSKPVKDASTGRVLLKGYLNNFGKDMDAEYLGTTVKSFLIDDFDEVADFMVSGDRVNCHKEAWAMCKKAFGNPELFYAGILGQVVGVSFDKLEPVVNLCSDYELSFSKIVNENPYLLQVLSTLDYSAIEHIALCVGKANDRSIDKERNIAVLHSYILNTRGNTVFKISDLYKKPIGVALSKAKYESCRDRGTYLSNNTLANLKYFIREDESEVGYNLSGGWQYFNYQYCLRLTPRELNDAIKDYTNSGIGVVFDNYITSSSYLDKELYVYEHLYEMGNVKIDYDINEIERYIAEYEAQVGFKLEENQRKAVHLCTRGSAIIAGSAGSGKTTVSNCIVYVLDKLERGHATFKFATPTGKAAKRLQEVVKKPVKTMNSLFKIFGTESSILDEDKGDASDEGTFYFFDEGAMVTIDLLYSVLKRISTNNRIFFFGDFHQLPPIGKGLPFRNLLRFMPCVFLTVSKRAEEGSNITRNSNYINENSDMNWKNLVSEGDFILCPCSDDMVKDITVGLCKHYLGQNTINEDQNLMKLMNVTSLPDIPNLKPSDIQVVSPLAKASYDWGTIRLNTLLQPIFNSNRGVKNTFFYQPSKDSYIKFLIGDRVIHSESNMYSMQWYESYTGGQFVKTFGFGICNGDVGKLVAVYPSSQCIFMEEQTLPPADFEYPQTMRDDSTYSGENLYFLVVEYFDYITNKNYYILYRCRLSDYSNDYGLALTGEAFSKLNLFYAGTTHKLQGSQAKLIISVLKKVNYQHFITRNMMYTVFTRAEKQVFAIGSVSNDRNSMLSIARRDVAEEDVLTIGELLYKV